MNVHPPTPHPLLTMMAGDAAAQAALAVQHAERTAARKNLADEESGAAVVGMTTEEKHAAARAQPACR